MKHIKLFEEFNQNTLYCFDLDNTLVVSPEFEELAVEYLKESAAIEDSLKQSADRINVNVDDFRVENDRIYVDDPEHKINVIGNWVRKGKRVYLISPNKFGYSKISFPTKLKDLSKLYNSVENKAIITARPESLRKEIEEVLKKFNLDIPKYGLFMFPVGAGVGNPGQWKAKVIIDLVKKTGFHDIKFYDDKPKIVNRVVREVKKEFPEIKIEGIKVK